MRHFNTMQFKIAISELQGINDNKSKILSNDIFLYKVPDIHTRAENWWHISTQKPPNVGSSSAISEPIIAGLVSARGLPNPMKLGNQLHRPTQTG